MNRNNIYTVNPLYNGSTTQSTEDGSVQSGGTTIIYQQGGGTGLTDAQKQKLDGIQEGAEVNQNAYSKVRLNGSDTLIIEAKNKTDILNVSGVYPIAIAINGNGGLDFTVSSDQSNTNSVVTQSQLKAAIDQLEKDKYWKVDADGKLYTELDVYSHKEISAYGAGTGGGSTGGAGALYECADVLRDGDKVKGAEVGSVLSYNGTHWYAIPQSAIVPDLSGYATKSYVSQEINDLIGGAPGTLDTLKEIAEALGNDPNFATTITNMINNIGLRVDDIEARVVSLEDMFEWDKSASASDPSLWRIKAKKDLYGVGEISAYGYSSGTVPTGAQYMYELKDVLFTELTSGQLLQWNGTKWINIDKNAVGLNESELAKYLTTNNYAKKADITWANLLNKPTTWAWADITGKPTTLAGYGITDGVPNTRRVSAGSGLSGGGTLSSDVTISLGTIGTAGTYTKITTDMYGRVVSGTTLSEGDIPTLQISKISGLQSALNSKLNISDFNTWFTIKKDSQGRIVSIQANYDFFSVGEISAYGLGETQPSVTTLAGLDDVTITSPANGQTLIYDSATSQWKNGTIIGGGNISLNGTVYKPVNGTITLPNLATPGDITTALNGYATQAWVTDKNYATQSWVNGKGYVTATALATMGFATQAWVNSQGFLKSNSLDNYVTLNTIQTITGTKTFNTPGGLKIGGPTGITLSNSSAGNLIVANLSNTAQAGIEASLFKKLGGTSSQFLKADGSVDGNLYALAYEGNQNKVQYSYHSRLASYLQVIDRRSEVPKPNSYESHNISAFFNMGKSNGMPEDNWWSGFHVRGWGDGYCTWELIGPSSTGNTAYNLRYRTGIGDTWGDWKMIMTDVECDKNYVKKAGDTMTGNLNVPFISTAVNPDNQGNYFYSSDDNFIRRSTWHAALTHLSQKQLALDLTSLDQNKWYPCIIGAPARGGTPLRITLFNGLRGNKPSWGLHQQGFSLLLDYEVTGSGWGTIPIAAKLNWYAGSNGGETAFGGRQQNTMASTEIIYLRGGGIYYYRTTNGDVLTVQPNGYTWSSGSYNYSAPVKTSQDNSPMEKTFDQVYWAPNNLRNTRTIWGQPFNGSQNVSGALSGATTITATGDITTSANIGGRSIYASADLTAAGYTYCNGRLYVDRGRYSSTATPSISLAIGDTDTGFHWESDGIISIYCNNSAVGGWRREQFRYGHGYLKEATGNDYHTLGIMVNGNGTANTIKPGIGFHQPGVFAGSIRMNDGSTFGLYAQGGSGLANLSLNGWYTNFGYINGDGIHLSSGWLRTVGATGWYNETYAGGMYMADSTWVRVYNGKQFYVSSTSSDAIHTAGGINASGRIYAGGHLSTNGGLAVSGIYGGSGASGFNVYAVFQGRSDHGGIEVRASDNTFGIGVHSNDHMYWWWGTSTSTNSSSGKSYIMDYGGGNWSFTGSIVASGEVTAYSDARLKSNIHTLNYRGRLIPRHYVKDGKQSIGFIAQEVQTLYPELVLGYDKSRPYLSLNYNGCTAVLSAQLNHVEDEVTMLKNKVRELEIKVSVLTEQLHSQAI